MGLSQSLCPVCRGQYRNFPAIVAPLHQYLLKRFPERMRERHVELAEDEEKNDTHSAQVPEAPFERDMLRCCACKEVSVGVRVVNCGHIFCRTCCDAAVAAHKCPECDLPVPQDPRPCLLLAAVVGEQFPEAQGAAQEAGASSVAPQEDEQRPKEFVYEHFGVGCDGCGSYPIQETESEGGRWSCKDCPEAMGFDLCGRCFHGGVTSGRFSQAHTAEHRMERMPRVPTVLHRLLQANPGMNVDQLLSILNVAMTDDGDSASPAPEREPS